MSGQTCVREYMKMMLDLHIAGKPIPLQNVGSYANFMIQQHVPQVCPVKNLEITMIKDPTRFMCSTNSGTHESSEDGPYVDVIVKFEEKSMTTKIFHNGKEVYHDDFTWMDTGDFIVHF